VGTEDHFDAAALEAIGSSLRVRGDGSELFVYEGAHHAFMNDQREAYRPEDSDLAFERAVAFFAEKLGAPVPV
jgi:carboxymethylenebutenolidase